MCRFPKRYRERKCSSKKMEWNRDTTPVLFCNFKEQKKNEKKWKNLYKPSKLCSRIQPLHHKKKIEDIFSCDRFLLWWKNRRSHRSQVLLSKSFHEKIGKLDNCNYEISLSVRQKFTDDDFAIAVFSIMKMCSLWDCNKAEEFSGKLVVMKVFVESWKHPSEASRCINEAICAASMHKCYSVESFIGIRVHSRELYFCRFVKGTQSRILHATHHANHSAEKKHEVQCKTQIFTASNVTFILSSPSRWEGRMTLM